MALDFLYDNSLKYIMIYQYWIGKWVKKHYGFQKSTVMMLLMLYELKRPISPDEWDVLREGYSFTKSSRDIMYLDGLGYIKRLPYKRLDELREKTRERKLTIATKRNRIVTSYMYQITDVGIQVADEIRANIKHRIDTFTLETLRDMKKY